MARKTSTSTLDRGLGFFPDPQPRGHGRWQSPCPAHDDDKPSLSISCVDDEKRGGWSRLVFKCHAGCEGKDVLRALGCSGDDLRFPTPAGDVVGSGPKRRARTASGGTAKGRTSPEYTLKHVRDDHGALILDRDAFRYATETRGLTQEVIDRRMLGYHSGGAAKYDGLAIPRFREGVPTYRKVRVIAPPPGASKMIRYPSGVESHLYNIDDLQPGGTVIVTEGEIDALSLESAGVGGGEIAIVSIADGVETAAKPSTIEPLREQARIFIAMDADAPGERAAREMAAALGAERCVRLTLPGYKDANEALVALGVERLRALVEERMALATPVGEAGDVETDAPPADADTRPVINLGLPMEAIIDAAGEVLARAEDVYQYAGRLVHLIRTPQTETTYGDLKWSEGPLSVSGVGAHRLQEILASAATWNAADGTTIGRPPMWVVNALFERQQWPHAKRLRSILDVPTLLPDGTILSAPGYNEESGLYYAPSGLGEITVSERPTQDDAQRAAGEILDVVADFPFATPSDRAAWLAALLTPFATWAFAESMPVVVITANLAGAGKGKLASIIGHVATGQPISPTAAPATDEECEKKLITLASAGVRLVLFDNVRGDFGWPALEMVVTSSTISGRSLGRNDASAYVNIPWRPFILSTGNNMRHPGVDTTRRVLPIRLESGEENPELRTDFKYPNLDRHVVRHRGELVRAALTILRAYCVAGRPPQRVRDAQGERSLPPWGSFQGWSDLVRSAVVFAGQPDPAGHRGEYAEKADRETDFLRSLFAAWSEVIGEKFVSLSDLIATLTGDGEARQALALALREINGRSRDFDTKVLGIRLGQFERRTVNGHRLEKTKDEHLKVNLWRVVSVEGTGAEAGKVTRLRGSKRGGAVSSNKRAAKF